MYCLEICSICFTNSKDLKYLSDDIKNDITYYEKLAITIPEMVVGKRTAKKLICEQCRWKIDSFYEFRQVCLKSEIIFNDYVNKLSINGRTIGKIKVHICDIGANKYWNNANIEEKTKLFPLENNEECFVDPSIVKTEIVVVLDPDDIYKSESPLNDTDRDTNADYFQCNPELETISLNENKDYYSHLNNLKQIPELVPISVYRNEDYYSNINKLRQNSQLEIISLNGNDQQDDPVELSSNNTTQPNNNGTKEPYTCNICFRQFNLHRNYIKHQLRHEPKSSHPCKTCNAPFNALEDLTKHLEHCDTQGQKRKMNVVMALCKKKLKCDLCDNTYTSTSGLQKHLRKHMGLRPYVCEFCNKAFICASGLRIHTRKHTGEKPFQCSKCFKPFADNSNLVRHLIKHHPETLKS